MERIFNFLRDVKVELTKVTWPTREQLIQYTMIVIGITVFVAVFLGAVDFVLQSVLNRTLLI
jgi:preprotein translocase subunit SecE